jgi:hypothetical protein
VRRFDEYNKATFHCNSYRSGQTQRPARVKRWSKNLGQSELEALVKEAHEKICPYSHATRGNVQVVIEVIGVQSESFNNKSNLGGLIVTIKTLARKFVELCNQGKNFDVMRTMYAPDIVSVEGDGAETAGQEPVTQKSAMWQGNNEIHSEKVRGPYFSGPNQFAVHFTFEYTPKATGERMTLEEVGVYTVKGDKITREQFYYDGTH